MDLYWEIAKDKGVFKIKQNKKVSTIQKIEQDLAKDPHVGWQFNQLNIIKKTLAYMNGQTIKNMIKPKASIVKIDRFEISSILINKAINKVWKQAQQKRNLPFLSW